MTCVSDRSRAREPLGPEAKVSLAGGLAFSWAGLTPELAS